MAWLVGVPEQDSFIIARCIATMTLADRHGCHRGPSVAQSARAPQRLHESLRLALLASFCNAVLEHGAWSLEALERARARLPGVIDGALARLRVS